MPEFSLISWLGAEIASVLSAVSSCWQLMTEATKILNIIFIYVLKVIFVPNFIFLGWFSFSSAVNSFWQPMTTVMKKIEWNLHIHPSTDLCAKFELPRLIWSSARVCGGVGGVEWVEWGGWSGWSEFKFSVSSAPICLD